jgi:hypothetical protein
MNLITWVGIGSLIVCSAAFAAQPQGGVFIPRNGGYEGRIGEAHLFVDTTSGGELQVVRGEWPRLEPLATVEMDFLVQKPGLNEPTRVQQRFDHDPEVQFLEEGNDRIGVRVKCELYDQAGVYHGHAMTETWLYRNGEMFVTAGAAFEDPLAHEGVPSARVALRLTEDYSVARLGTEDGAQVELAQIKGAPRRFELTDTVLPGRYAVATGDGKPALGLYWRGLKIEHNTVVFRGEGKAPNYYRWPTYYIQAYQGARPPRTLELAPHSVAFAWPPSQEVRASFGALFRLAVLDDAEAVRDLVRAERDPVELTVEGGAIHGNLGGYNDQDGAYEVRKDGNPMAVRLPADPMGRTVRIKAIALTGHGAVTAELDGEPVVPHLSSDGGIADDPLAPIRQHPEGPADMALVPVKLGDRPRTLTFREQPGVQLAYQQRDRWRNVACFTSHGQRRYAGFRFSLRDGRARNMRAYGNREWALTENLLLWFSWCGFTSAEMVDDLVDFEILKNGPDEAVFRYVSENANGRARSEYVVRVPADPSAMQVNVTATFTAQQNWPYDEAQFFDVFPFRGVNPQDWWYDHVLWLAPDGRVKTMDTREWTYQGDTDLARITGGGFFALYGSDRGNMVMLTKNFEPALPVDHIICANYIDYHMAVRFLGDHAVSDGFAMRMQYDLALWGNTETTREELVSLGKRSIEAGRLVWPEP